MRKIWKMRKSFFPQAAALLAVLTVVALSPNAGVCSVQANKILSNTSAEGTIITTVYETKDEEGKLVVRTTSPVKKKVTDHPRAASAKDPRSEIFHGELDTSVISALN